MLITKSNSAYIVFIFLLAGVHLTYAVSDSSREDPYPSLDFPVFQGGYNVRKTINAKQGIKSVTYRVSLSYPPVKIIEFYDAFFNSSGWISAFETCQRHWAEPIEGSTHAELSAKQMFASWMHPALALNAVLWLTYESNESQRPKEVIVEARLQSTARK